MRNLRSAARKRRRFKVLLGTAVSFTTDVSPGGFCTETMRILAPKSLVNGFIEGSGKKVPFTGRVVWTVPGDPTVNLRGRMGISFIESSPELLDLLKAQ
jgi:hypothetical protein